MVLYFQNQLSEAQEYLLFQKYIDCQNIRNQKEEHRNSSLSRISHSPTSKVFKDNHLEILSYQYIKETYSPENIQEKMIEWFGQECIVQCSQEDWKLKKQGFEQVSQRIGQKKSLSEEETNYLCQFLEMQTKGFQESNLLINFQVIEIFRQITHLSINKEVVLKYFSILFIKKLAEKKYQSKIEDIMLQYQNLAPFHMIFHLILKAITEETSYNPKTLIEVCSLFIGMVNQSSTFVKEDVKTFFAILLNNTNQEIRK